jgi:DNA-binding XRE family transcriptional regulator
MILATNHQHQHMTLATLHKLDPKAIRERLSLPQEKASSILKISVKTLSRAEKEGRSLKDSDARSRLAKLDEIGNLAQAIYTIEGIKEFLNTPLPIFEGYTALDLMAIGDYDRVIAALAADYEGLGY